MLPARLGRRPLPQPPYELFWFLVKGSRLEMGFCSLYLEKYGPGYLVIHRSAPFACFAASRTARLAHLFQATSNSPFGHAIVFSLKMMIWRSQTTRRSHSSFPSPLPDCCWSRNRLGYDHKFKKDLSASFARYRSDAVTPSALITGGWYCSKRSSIPVGLRAITTFPEMTVADQTSRVAAEQ